MRMFEGPSAFKQSLILPACCSKVTKAARGDRSSNVLYRLAIPPFRASFSPLKSCHSSLRRCWVELFPRKGSRI